MRHGVTAVLRGVKSTPGQAPVIVPVEGLTCSHSSNPTVDDQRPCAEVEEASKSCIEDEDTKSAANNCAYDTQKKGANQPPLMRPSRIDFVIAPAANPRRIPPRRAIVPFSVLAVAGAYGAFRASDEPLRYSGLRVARASAPVAS
ncbi:hypothetical protein U6G28_01965 [Actinomycetaceae bacterium MB13-C1-2]|nr:hypothetical protein U6G28_01965 [Actinomycetaceae bacterium MB13-C1-2]